MNLRADVNSLVRKYSGCEIWVDFGLHYLYYGKKDAFARIAESSMDHGGGGMKFIMWVNNLKDAHTFPISTCMHVNERFGANPNVLAFDELGGDEVIGEIIASGGIEGFVWVPVKWLKVDDSMEKAGCDFLHATEIGDDGQF